MKKGKPAPLMKYLSLTKAGIMESATFRASYLITFFGNLIYLVVIYFLWKAIYASSPSGVVAGMTFQDTLIYLVLASSLFSFMQVWIVERMGWFIRDGQIVVDLIKPMDLQVYYFFTFLGDVISNFFITFLPTFIIVKIITGGAIAISNNLLFFGISMILGFLINYCIDFFVGTICLYTESTWGINIMKEVVVLLLSGATIPLAFFPDSFRTILYYLPFQAIYNVPLTILIDKNLGSVDYLRMLGIQVFWIVIMLIVSRLFWKQSSKIITINGG